ncbi:MAG: hypothetical protein ACRD18_17875 [Terriglobia bacterium]
MGNRSKQFLSLMAVLGLSLCLVAMPSFAKSQKSKKSKTATTAAQSSASQQTAQQAPSKGMVWVNPKSKVFHREGDRWYGKTKNGKYMTEAEAIKEGYHEAKRGAAHAKAKP